MVRLLPTIAATGVDCGHGRDDAITVTVVANYVPKPPPARAMEW